MTSISILEIIGGLMLFLLGVLELARGIEPLATARSKSILSRFTTNRFAGIATGMVATTILDSSSVTIIMVIERMIPDTVEAPREAARTQLA